MITPLKQRIINRATRQTSVVLARSFSDFFSNQVWLAMFWKTCLEEVTQQNKALGLVERGIMLDLNYEELCSNPFETLDQICHFIDLTDLCQTSNAYK